MYTIQFAKYLDTIIGKNVGVVVFEGETSTEKQSGLPIKRFLFR